MSTGNKKAQWHANQTLTRLLLQDRMLDYLEADMVEAIEAYIQGRPSVFSSSALDLVGDGSDKFKIGISDVAKVASGDGRVMSLAPNILKETSAIPFPNSLGITYEVGVRHNFRDADAVIENRKGTIRYSAKQSVIGEVGLPDAVTDHTTYVRVIIDTLTESGNDHSGRNVIVWLSAPASSVESVAFFTGVSAYDGTNNYVDIPYAGGDGPLGQNTTVDPPSTTASEYQVHVKGVTVRTGTLTAVSVPKDYFMLGAVTGAGTGNPPTFDVSTQNPAFLITLDKAYDGAGAGLGNVINVDIEDKPLQVDCFVNDPVINPGHKDALLVRSPDGQPVYAIEQFGRVARSPFFRDEFCYESGWLAAASAPKSVYNAVEGTGLSRTQMVNSAHTDFGDTFGAALVSSAAGAATRSYIEGHVFSAKSERPNFYARVMFRGMEASYTAHFGLGGNWTATPFIGQFLGFRVANNVLQGMYTDPTNASLITTASLGTVVAGTAYEVYFAVTSATTIQFMLKGGTVQTLTIPTIDAGIWDMRIGARAESTGGSSNLHELIVDAWEVGLHNRLRGATI